MNALQPWHLIILVLLVVILFGAKRLPDAARSIGKSMKIFKAETKDMKDKSDSDTDGVTDVETKALPQSQPTATSATAAPGADKQVDELQRQLDELKKQQAADAARKNVS